MRDFDKEQLSFVRKGLELHLSKVHRNSMVTNWIKENYDILDVNLLPVIKWANETMDNDAFGMMTMAVLCNLPEDLEDLAVLSSNLSTSNHPDLLTLSLCSFPRQKKVSFD